jgi:hypothetical protein
MIIVILGGEILDTSKVWKVLPLGVDEGGLPQTKAFVLNQKLMAKMLKMI